VDPPPWPATELDRAQPSGCFGAQWLARGGATGRGVGGESISGLTRVRAAGRRLGDGGEEMVEEALSVGDTWAWREEKESGEMCGGERWSSAFI
jgi:hypothetical protein